MVSSDVEDGSAADVMVVRRRLVDWKGFCASSELNVGVCLGNLEKTKTRTTYIQGKYEQPKHIQFDPAFD